MDEHEAKFYSTLMRCIAAIILILIVSITVYSCLDIAGPIRPKQSMQYYWPR